MTRELVQAPSTKVYFDTTFQSQAARILPGEYHVTREAMVIVTVLGSCVAACLRDPDSGIGGMNHFLLPDTSGGTGGTGGGGTGGGGRDAEGDSARYGSYAMEVLINQLVKLGARRHRLEAKVFGGANVIPGMHQLNIGQRNADFVLEFLRTERIPVIAADLEDTCPRKVAYFPRTGVVRMKRLVDAGSREIVQREQRYKAQFSQAPIAGDIELFG